jgi:hypothetical protein
MTRWLLVLALVGCTSWPLELRTPTEAEERAIGAARQAWGAAGRPRTDCPALASARIAVVPHDELQERCSATVEVVGCLLEAPPLSSAPPLTILVSAQQDDTERGSTAIHEALHALRSCAVAEGHELVVEADCPIRYAADNDHCDRELWGPIHADALARWSRP